MTRIHAFVVSGLVSLVPSVASAVVAVNVEKVFPQLTGQDQTVFLEVWLTDLDNSDERLTIFTLSLDGVRFSGTGVRFAPPAHVPTVHPYVFKDVSDAEMMDIASTAIRIQVTGETPTGEVNVAEGRNGLVRIPVFIPADFSPTFPFIYPVVVDLQSTQFPSAGAPIVHVLGQEGGLFFLPEPSGIALGVMPALCLLRRRRR